MLITILLFLTYYLILNEASHPINIAVIERTTVTLECSTTTNDTKIQWHWCAGGTVAEGIISDGKRILNEDLKHTYSINTTDTGQFDLIINSTAMSQAGTYICEETGTALKWSAEVIVLASNPNCSCIQIDDNTYSMSCSVILRGNWVPTMRWTRDGNDIISEGVTQTEANFRVVRYTLSLNASQTNFRYKCTTNFSETRRPLSANAAPNIPDYKFTWNYTPEFKKRHLQSTDRKDWYYILLVAVGASFVVLVVVAASLVLGCFYISRKPAAADSNLSTEHPRSNHEGESIVRKNKTHDGSENHCNLVKIPFKIIGDDGTEYIQVNFASSINNIHRCQSIRTHENNSGIYASIDHTIRPPPLESHQHNK